MAANQLLQSKVELALRDVARFLINITEGVLSFFGVAAEMGLPSHNEDFGQNWVDGKCLLAHTSGFYLEALRQ